MSDRDRLRAGVRPASYVALLVAAVLVIGAPPSARFTTPAALLQMLIVVAGSFGVTLTLYALGVTERKPGARLINNWVLIPVLVLVVVVVVGDCAGQTSF